MADKPTAVDILSEAMEYLSKLGLKLRTRSDSMKEKKIKQNRLRNSHAVKKTANKVLLLCELSKKSLNIVETTVKNILTVVGSEQADNSDGGKSRNRSSTDGDTKTYFYFDYGSRKLKITKKVSIKHYTSVKVLAKKMPKVFLKKYPVYYDCKLLRLRKSKEACSKSTPEKEMRKLSVESRGSSAREIKHDKVHSNEELSNSSMKKKSDDKERVLESDSNNVVTKRSISSMKKKSDDKNRVLESDSDNGVTKGSISSIKKKSDDKKMVLESDSDDGVTKGSISSMKKKFDDKKRVLESDSDDGVTKGSISSMKKTSDNKKRLLESDSEGEVTNSKVSESLNKENNVENESDNSNTNDHQTEDDENRRKELDVNEDESEKDIIATTKLIDDLNECTNKNTHKDTKEYSSTKEMILHTKEDKRHIEKDLNKSTKESEESSTSKKSDKIISLEDIVSNNKESKNHNDVINLEDSDNDRNNDSSDCDKNKPVIKCVSISKLLKPTVLQKVGSSLVESCRKSPTEEKRKSGLKNPKKMSSTPKRVTYADEEEFWAPIRKQVAEFKPKIFTINITRLPKWSNLFLNQNNIKKITQNGKLIYECTESLDETNKEVSDQIDLEDNGKDPEPDILTVKKALLNDSDSEKSDIIVTSKDRGKSTAISKSCKSLGSDSSNEIEKITENIEKISSKNSDVRQSGDDSKKTESCAKEASETDNREPENTEKTPEPSVQDDGVTEKGDLGLGEKSVSSAEKSKTNEDTPTKSKRKHIMESMKAKKMLLTYSSSDTEDDKLNEVLKEIKGSLLKEASSDEEVKKKQQKKKSSSSEPDIEHVIKKVKEKRKRALSTSSEESRRKPKKSHKRKSKSKDKEPDSKKMGRSADKAGTSSQNSDTQDDKDIDGLSNINSLSKTRRRRGSSSTDEKPTRSSSRKKMSVPSLITGEGLLEAPESSDSEPESDTVEELPPISLSGLNGGGGGLEHLAKDDLLGDSDSSSSNNKDDADEEKHNDSDNEDNVKSKRNRKANTISSDSEGGSKPKKEDKDVRLSDFEDSEDESSEPAKRKRKKKQSDSDGSGSGTDGGSKKKRRRIKQINDSDASGSDSENEGRKHGRKNIRKVMGKNQLEEATKKAARQEKERIARIAERQKFYNNLEFDETGKPDEVIPDKLVLDFDLETKEPIIEVDKGLVKKLKPHQANGIRFMWDACFESVKRIKKDRGSGCILAHCMGLGKTLQVVALTHTLLTHSELTKVNRVLVVCPLSTVLNWVNEFQMWLKHSNKESEIDVYELSRFKQNSERAYQLSQWLAHGGVCVLGYEMFRNLSADNTKKYKKKMLKNFQEALVDPGPDLVVCDEGHLLKNEKTSLSQSMNRVRTLRRIVLTGTPLQNNLKEYYCMVQFVKPNLLGKYNEYLNRFVNPITNGQYTDSTEHDIKIMKRRSHVLHKMLDGAVQRRDYSVLAPFLPPKHEYVLFITLSEVQINLYQHYLDKYSRRPLPGKSSGFLFPDFQSLQRIWTHPLVLKYNSERYEIMQQKKREREEEDSEGSLVDFIDDDSTPEESSTEESSDDLSDVSDDSRKKSKKKKSAKKSKAKDGKASTRRGTRANPVELDDDDVKDISDVVEVKNDNPTEWWIPLVTDDELEDIRHSHKLMLLFDILRQSEAIGDKLLVFSQSLYSLDLIEHFLGKVDEATQEGRIDEKLGGHVGSWSPGVDYFRLDGSTSCENRSIWCKNFNREDNPRARLFLISTRAGGLGINLVAANRVIIFDVSWNPSHDVQSIFRVYRFGQKKPCYIYRFLAMGTMEEKIYERQVTKQAISKRVIDEQQIDRHYAENDLAELYKFEPRPPVPRPLPPVPKDRMFAELLKVHDALIYKFHEHDSLLENKEEETLSEEERKAAWEDFENEKNRPPPSPYPTWPMNNGMVNNLLAQQQQQLAYAALATMLRKDMPNISDDQLRNMLPLIYGANPGLMQKLSDIYKYPGGGMMNPILNSVMNSGTGGGGGGGMGGGGTSGLQYEPPWARDQQQQQQIRLQQLMQQQQNSMGAKMYAGGLGSRDPVAMALQQQRARELMMQQAAAGAGLAGAGAGLPGAGAGLAGAGAGRQRGRPPHQPRPRPPVTTDVVTLDSD